MLKRMLPLFLLFTLCFPTLAWAQDDLEEAMKAAEGGVTKFEGGMEQLVDVLRAEGLDQEAIFEVEQAIRDAVPADGMLEQQVRPIHICDWHAPRPCRVPWQFYQLVISAVQQWQQHSLCSGRTECGSLYRCVYRALHENRTILNVCHCPERLPWGFYWSHQTHRVLQCTTPTCSRVMIDEPIIEEEEVSRFE